MTKPVTRKLAVNCLLERFREPRLVIIAGEAVLITTPLLCTMCKEPLLPGQAIQFDHIHADVHDGPHDYRNLRPIHYDPCHKKKTKADKQALAKGDRLLGLTCNGPKRKIATRGFDKSATRKMPSRPMRRRA